MNTIRARVCAVHRATVQLRTPDREISASVSISHSRASTDENDPLSRPTVGDWVIVEMLDENHYRVIEIEPRISTLVRRSAGSNHTAQLLAANVDTAFIFSPYPEQPNVRRLARLVSLALAGNVIPVIVLSRTDTVSAETVSQGEEAIAAYLPEIPVVATSSIIAHGLHAIDPWLWPGATVVLLGPSGAGKSTMLNALAGEELMRTGDTRDDGAGRHTTTHRSLSELASGLVVIDTPGLREVGLWASPDVTDKLFADIAALSEQCRFRDCTHAGEPGCAVAAAVSDGTIDADRWAQWQELRRETAYLERTESERKRRERSGSLAMRRISQHKK